MLEKILVVDSDTDTRNKFYELFSSLGFRPTCVSSYKEALLCLTDERPDLLIIDSDDSGEDLFQTVKKIREFDTDLKILVVYKESAKGLNAEEVKELSVQALVKKDFSTHVMMKEILMVLNRKQSFHEQAEMELTVNAFCVMIVDDNEQIREMLYNFLLKLGYKTQTASCGEDALMKIKIKKPQIVLLDMRMPGMDGLMVLKKIKEIDESIKVIMLTSAQEEYMVQEAKQSGACDYLFKPCNFNELEAILASLRMSE